MRIEEYAGYPTVPKLSQKSRICDDDIGMGFLTIFLYTNQLCS